MRNPRNPLALAALMLAAGLAQAQTAATTAPLTPSQQYAADSKQLQARYQSDLSICNSETDSAGRMQCKRDAKTEYDKALAEAKARAGAAAPAKSEALCADCGRVTAVATREKEGEPSAAGLIAGGIGGALLVWVVGVTFAGNQTAQYEFAQDPGYKAGDLVKKSGNGLARP